MVLKTKTKTKKVFAIFYPSYAMKYKKKGNKVSLIFPPGANPGECKIKTL